LETGSLTFGREAVMLVFNVPLDLLVALAPFAAIFFWWLVSE
jgi:hypothetical protein